MDECTLFCSISLGNNDKIIDYPKEIFVVLFAKVSRFLNKNPCIVIRGLKFA